MDKGIFSDQQIVLNITLANKILFIPNYVIWWRTEAGYMLLDVKQNQYFHLEDVGGQIWQNALEGHSEEAIFDQLAHEYSKDIEHLKNDTDDFIEDMVGNGLLNVSRNKL